MQRVFDTMIAQVRGSGYAALMTQGHGILTAGSWFGPMGPGRMAVVLDAETSHGSLRDRGARFEADAAKLAADFGLAYRPPT